MLSNQDFGKYYGQGGGGEGGGVNEKVRYDLKQIKKWDNEIKVKLNNQQGGKNPKDKKGGYRDMISSERKEKFNDDLEYRDRAKERRKMEGQGEEDEQMVILSKLSAEETQFLGGDMEHTHLVKGLDYALLNKVRSEVDILEKSNPKLEVARTEYTHSKGDVRSRADRDIVQSTNEFSCGEVFNVGSFIRV
jgi:hypothetical protein